MSEALDLRLILQNTDLAARAAEAALTLMQRLETELGHRMTALEARFSGLDGRVPALAAGINSHEPGLLRLNDKLLDHDGRFDGIDKRLSDHDRRFDGIDKRLDGIETTLAAMLAKLP